MDIQTIIDKFHILIAKVFALEEKGATFKAREYRDVIKALQESGKTTLRAHEAEPLLRAYGKKIPPKVYEKLKKLYKLVRYKLWKKPCVIPSPSGATPGIRIRYWT